jgi:DNA polymerase-3 subunit alpha
VLETAKLKRRAAKLSGEKDDGETLAPAAPAYRELHIRLKAAAAEREEDLYPLRDYLYSAACPCSVFIHVPIREDETVIRTAAQITASAEASCIETLTLCEGVAEVWPE